MKDEYTVSIRVHPD